MTSEIAKVEEVKPLDTVASVETEQAAIMRAVSSEIDLIPEIDKPFRFQLSRLGKIRIGINRSTDPAKKIPQAVDHFVLPDELRTNEKLRQALEELGEDPDKPRKLRIWLPCNALAGNLRSSCDLYGANGRVKCRTYDNITCTETNMETGEMVDKPCRKPSCGQFESGGCHWVHRLRYILPDAPGFGVWQTDTPSPNNRTALIQEMTDAKRIFGGVLGGIDLLLTLEQNRQFHVPVTNKSGTTTVIATNPWLLHIRSDMTPREMVVAAKDSKAYDSVEIEDFDMTADPEAATEANADGSFDVGAPAQDVQEAEYTEPSVGAAEKPTQPTPQPAPTQASECCDKCGKPMTKGQRAISQRKFDGAQLCLACQKEIDPDKAKGDDPVPDSDLAEPGTGDPSGETLDERVERVRSAALHAGMTELTFNALAKSVAGAHWSEKGWDSLTDDGWKRLEEMIAARKAKKAA